MSNKNNTNPYLDARREWNERYGSYMATAKNWRIVAILTSLSGLIATLGIIYIASQSKILPYLVEVDKHGELKYGGTVEKMSTVDENVMKYALSDFIINLRTIYPDNNIQRDYIFKVYNYLSASLPANKLVDDFYKVNPPFGLKYNQKVTIENVTHIQDNQWQLDWSETRYGENGALIDTQVFRAVVQTMLNPPSTEESARKNPIGLFIKDLTISKIIK